MPEACVLLIDDEEPILRFLRNALKGQAYKLVEAVNAAEGLAKAASHQPDLVLLDLGLPDRDGLEVLKELRGWTAMPVIILSARGQEQDKIKGLDAGADDYLTKPFSVGELLARMRACLRRKALGTQDHGEPIFTLNDLRVDLAARQVFVRDNEVKLTPIEYRLLTEFVRHAGKVLTHRHLLKEVWNMHDETQSHYVRIFVHQLRRKIETDSARPALLLTEPGVGYRLRDEG
jgi:two-component system, OmpR family, KDP operon response regulator KdpE